MMGKKSQFIFLLILIFLISIAAHFPTLKNGFTNWDDPRLLINNANIRGLSIDHFGKLFLTSYGGLGGYTPLVFLSYALEYRFFGLNPRAFHATNLLLHAMNALLIFWLIYLVSGGISISFVTAVLFAIHPLHVEPVAWIQGRKDLLFSLFYLSGLIFYIRFIKKSCNRACYYLALLLFSLSLFSKVAAISFPLVILLIEKQFTKRLDKSAFIRSMPFWAMAGFFFILAFVTHSPSPGQTPTEPPGFLQNLGTFFYAFAFYARKILVPIGLLPRYSSGIGHHPGQVILTLCLFAALCALSYYAYRRKPDFASFGIGFAVLALLPTLPFHFIGQPYADRYMYLPIAGILFVMAGLLPPRVFILRPLAREAVMAWPAVILIVLLLGINSWKLNRIWHDSLSLWSYVVETDPANTMGYLNRAEALFNNGQLSEAMSDYNAAQMLAPKDPNIPQSKGAVYFKRGEFEKAMEEYNQSLSLDPLFHDGYMSRGMLWARLGDFSKAISDFTAALKLNKTSKGYMYRALAYMEEKKLDQALDDLRSAYDIEPTEQVRGLITSLSSTRDRHK